MLNTSFHGLIPSCGRPLRAAFAAMMVALAVTMAAAGAGPAATAAEMSAPGATPAPVVLPAPDEPGQAAPALTGGLTVLLPDGTSRMLPLAALEALGTYAVRTHTFWPADDGVYQGPLLRDVVRAAGLGAAGAIRLSAVDGFSQVIPAEDWQRWPVLLATRHDGRPMPLGDKGPLRVIYPRDMDRTLEDQVYRLRWVWMVKSLEAVAP